MSHASRGVLAAILLLAPMSRLAAQTAAPAASVPAAAAKPAATTTEQPPAPQPPGPAPNASGAAATGNSVERRSDLGTLPSAADLRPTGPVTVTAKHAELIQGDSAIYTGNVVMDSDTLKLDGDRLELHQDADGQYVAKITGTPGHMAHAGAGPDNPPVSAHARTLNYNSRTGIVDLIGDALFRRGSDEITGDVIHYNVVERHIDASGGDGGQVRIVIQAPPPAPAPATNNGAPATTTATPSGGGQSTATPPNATPARPPAPAGAMGASPQGTVPESATTVPDSHP